MMSDPAAIKEYLVTFMEESSHYYAILTLCRLCSFTKESSQKIAHASQFVDDALINHISIKNPLPEIVCEMIDGKKSFYNMATCHSYLKMNTFNYLSMINNTAAFHFVPACEGNTFTKKLRCKQNNRVITDIIAKGMKEDNLIRLGMMLHAYADTYAHQGFSGILSEENGINNVKKNTKGFPDIIGLVITLLKSFMTKSEFDKFLDNAAPCYGHAQAINFPDEPYLEWEYSYDTSNDFSGAMKHAKIDNRQRYTEAFEQMEKYLETYLTRYKYHRDPLLQGEAFSAITSKLLGMSNFSTSPFIATLTKKYNSRRKIKLWKRFLTENGLFEKNDPALTYKPTLWLEEAFANYDHKTFEKRKVDDAELVPGFKNTAWYMYYESVHWYKNLFFQTCKKYKLNIPL